MKKEKKNIQVTKALLRHIFSTEPSLALLIPAKTLMAAMLPFVNYIASVYIIDEFLGTGDMQRLFGYAFAAVLGNVLLTLGIRVFGDLVKVRILRLELEFESMVSRHVMNMRVWDIESNRVQNLLRTIEQAKLRTGGICKPLLLWEQLMSGLLSLLMAVISFMPILKMELQGGQTGFWNSPWLLVILLIFSLGIFMTSFHFQMRINQRVVDLNKDANAANGKAMVYMQLMSDYRFGKDIRIYGMHGFLSRAFQNMWNSEIGYRLTMALGREKAKIPCMNTILDSILALFIYLTAAMKALNGAISVGSVVLYIGSVQVFTSSLSAVFAVIGQLLGSGALLEPYLELLSIAEEDSGTGKALPEAAGCCIEFKSVSFRYPNAEEWALQDVSFCLRSGEKIAVVGENGSGKTTMIKLLCRFYEPDSGHILLNGMDIQTIDLKKYRELLGCVFQDFSLWSLPLKDNIASGREAELPRLKTAFSKAGMEGWLEKKKRDFDLCLYRDFERDGIEPSGGEAQKIALARAIYKAAPMLVLDEPTAALDPRAEFELYESINRIVDERLVIFVSHRLSSCCFCDRILVFAHGRLQQEGSHDGLVQERGKYRQLWEAQAQLYQSH